MSHSSFRGSSDSSNESGNWQVSLIIFLQPISGHLFLFSSDFSDHENGLSFWVIRESLQDVNEVGSVEWISTDSDNGRLSQSSKGGLIDGLISQSTGSGNDSDFSLLMNISGHNSDFTFIWLNNSWAVRSNNSGVSLGSQSVLDSDHFVLWDTVSDDNDQINLGLDGLDDGSRSEWGWDIDN